MTRPRFGAHVDDQGTSFRVWAPAQHQIAVVFHGGRELPMTRHDDGFFTLQVADAGAGQRYWYRLHQGLRPDPASRFQPEGPLGPSEIVDARTFRWTDQKWAGAPPAHRLVIYEMHIGTFTAQGTWDAAAERLPTLADVGINTLQVMPIAEFSGQFGWGYDGVQLFAPTRLYGPPDAAKAFVNAAHALGLAVILDVVYNHLGPVGNFMSEFTPTFMGQAGEWGDLINYDGPGSTEVRAFVLENARYWIEQFHFDGLRFDATQAIRDASDEHIISEICGAVRGAATPRRVFLVGESEPQETRLLKHSGHADGLDAIWSEDWHHAAIVSLTGRRQAYFTDYQGTAAEFASMARHGTLYQGQWYSWQANPRGGYALGLPISAFVNFLENHDQIANTGLGTRLHQHVDQARWRAITALLLLGPAVPQLFQGQEFGSTRPFTYFADHEGDLAAAVEAGRSEFLTQFPGLSTREMRERLPKPGDATVFEQCKLLDDERMADGPLVRLHRDLLRLRRDDEVLREVGTSRVRIESSAPAPSVLLIRYIADRGHRLLIVNLADDHLSPMNDPLYAPVPEGSWAVQWTSDHPDYGGMAHMPFVEAGRWLIRAASATLLRSKLN